MASSVLPSADAVSAKSTNDRAKPDQSSLRVLRIRRGLTQEKLAALAGLHRNSLRKIEDGSTREVTPKTAAALARSLNASIEDLGVRVRRAATPVSVRVRKLSPDQRALLEELLALPPEDFAFIRQAVAALQQQSRAKKRKRG